MILINGNNYDWPGLRIVCSIANEAIIGDYESEWENINLQLSADIAKWKRSEMQSDKFVAERLLMEHGDE